MLHGIYGIHTVMWGFDIFHRLTNTKWP